MHWNIASTVYQYLWVTGKYVIKKFLEGANRGCLCKLTVVQWTIEDLSYATGMYQGAAVLKYYCTAISPSLWKLHTMWKIMQSNSHYVNGCTIAACHVLMSLLTTPAPWRKLWSSRNIQSTSFALHLYSNSSVSVCTCTVATIKTETMPICNSAWQVTCKAQYQ